MESYQSFKVYYKFNDDDYEYSTVITATSEEVARERLTNRNTAFCPDDITILRTEVLQ